MKANDAMRIHTDLVKYLMRDNDNVVISPMGIQESIGALGLGAGTYTEVLIGHFILALRGKSIEDKLEWIKRRVDNCESKSLVMANLLLVGAGNTIKEDYKERVVQYIVGAEALTVGSEEDREEVIRRVRELTDGKVEFTPSIGANGVVECVNIINFNAKWSKDYTDADLETGGFEGVDEEVTYICGRGHGYYSSRSAEAFMIDYKEKRFKFIGILPRKGLDEYIKNLADIDLKTIVRRMVDQEHKVDFKLPLFKIESNIDLKRYFTREESYYSSIFSTNADLSKMSRDKLFVSSMGQKNVLEVTREGTSAVSVTSWVANKLGHTQVDKIKLDRPFMFMIWDTIVNAPLFIGAVKDPTK